MTVTVADAHGPVRQTQFFRSRSRGSVQFYDGGIELVFQDFDLLPADFPDTAAQRLGNGFLGSLSPGQRFGTPVAQPQFDLCINSLKKVGAMA
jgi:hypothetical protein